MKSPNQIISALDDVLLRTCVRESMTWRKKGKLSGTALRKVASSLEKDAGVDEMNSLRMADTLVTEEAAKRFSAPTIPDVDNPSQTLLSAADNLIAQKGRHNTEVAYQRLVEVVGKIKKGQDNGAV